MEIEERASSKRIMIRILKINPISWPSYLEDALDGIHSREIMRLETTYQMGEDEKLDYNPIEKYLKCQQLIDNNFKPKEIAEMMNEKISKVDEWLEIMGLMDEYLDSLDYSGIYTRLEKRERTVCRFKWLSK